MQRYFNYYLQGIRIATLIGFAYTLIFFPLEYLVLPEELAQYSLHDTIEGSVILVAFVSTLPGLAVSYLINSSFNINTGFVSFLLYVDHTAKNLDFLGSELLMIGIFLGSTYLIRLCKNVERQMQLEP